MCRLFGLIANRPVDMKYSFSDAKTQSFKSFSEHNRHGWGVGWYPQGSRGPDISKQGIEDPELQSLAKNGRLPPYKFGKIDDILSHIMISHVRKATGPMKPKTKKNTHPFAYKNYIFAHNGSVACQKIIDNDLNDDFRQLTTESDTDTWIYFLLIMQFIESCGDNVQGIQEAVRRVKSHKNYTGLNFLLSDGTSLYGLRSTFVNKDYYSLYYLHRDPNSEEPLNKLSPETQQMLNSKRLAKEEAVLFCSECLTLEEWNLINLDRLIVINSDLTIQKIPL